MRIQFSPGQQRAFLEEVQRAICANLASLAGRLGVCGRTIRDWRREKWQMDERSLSQLCRLAKLPRPRRITLLSAHWSVQKVFRSNPEYFRQRGVAVRKEIVQPPRSADLAEWIGIVLGDGGMTRYQVTISLNHTLEAKYAEYVARLAARLFGLTSSWVVDRHDDALALIFSSVKLVELLERLGLRRGNKIRHRADIPSWIWEREEYRIACLRGLMDTDGCVYF